MTGIDWQQVRVFLRRVEIASGHIAKALMEIERAAHHIRPAMVALANATPLSPEDRDYQGEALRRQQHP